MNPPVVQFGQFKLVHEVAVGGMGEIFLGSDTHMSRPVAIKRVLEKFRTRPDVARMFEVEATIMSVLRHPNIVRVFESGELEGIFYLSMEYVHGKTLRQLVDRSREVGEALPPSLVIEIIGSLARALTYAHSMKGRSGRPMGLVHRDVNPSNLLIGYDGLVKLIDFGIVQTDDELAPEDLEPKGKFAYMSPEQTRGERVDQRSDLFSLGICLYEALTLYNPFIHEAKGDSAVEAIRSLNPPPISERNHRLAPFDPIVARALAKDPAERFQNADELIGELEAVGQQFKSFIPLSAFMTDLFEAQKTEEDALLERVELASSSTVMIDGGAAPAQTAPPAARPAPATAAPSAAFGWAFWALAAAIVLVTAVAAFRVYDGVLRERRVEALFASPTPSAVKERPEPRPPLPVSDDGWEDAGDEALEEELEVEVEAEDPEEPRDGVPDSARLADAAEPAAASEAPRARTARSKRDRPLASLNVSSDPSVRITHEDERLGRTDTIELFEPTGTVSLGRGRHLTRDPFAVSLDYVVEGDRLRLQVDAEPWAVVRGPGGVTLGRTPASTFAKSGTTSFELSNPRERRLMRIVVRFRPKRPS